MTASAYSLLSRVAICTIALCAVTASQRLAAAQDGNDKAAAPSHSPGDDTEQIRRWIAELGADDFATREAATEALSRAGKQALPLLEEAAKSPDAEVRWRAQKALETVRKRLGSAPPRPADTARAARPPAARPSIDPFSELERALRELERGLDPDEEGERDALLPEAFERLFEQLQRDLFERALQPGTPGRPGARSRGFMVLRFKDGKWVLEEMGSESEPGRAELGVETLPLSPLVRAQLRLEPGEGIGIERVLPGSLGARAGLERFDVVVAIDDRPVRTEADLELLREERPHTVTVVRRGERRTLALRQEEQQQPTPDTPEKH